jgi:Ca2+-transporting ATPase
LQRQIIKKEQWSTEEAKKVIEIAMWASEPVPLIRWKKATQGYQKQQQMTRADNFP